MPHRILANALAAASHYTIWLLLNMYLGSTYSTAASIPEHAALLHTYAVNARLSLLNALTARTRSMGSNPIDEQCYLPVHCHYCTY